LLLLFEKDPGTGASFVRVRYGPRDEWFAPGRVVRRQGKRGASAASSAAPVQRVAEEADSERRARPAFSGLEDDDENDAAGFRCEAVGTLLELL